jgi:hypothetical protein
MSHHPILPDFFWCATNDGAHPVGGIAPPPWDQASTLSFMDDPGIDVAVTSISTPGVHAGNDARARDLARRCNELAASMVQKRPDRSGGFAALRENYACCGARDQDARSIHLHPQVTPTRRLIDALELADGSRREAAWTDGWE